MSIVCGGTSNGVHLLTFSPMGVALETLSYPKMSKRCTHHLHDTWLCVMTMLILILNEQEVHPPPV